MKRAAAMAVLLMAGATLLAQQRGPSTHSKDDEIRLRARVEAIVMLADFAGTVIPVHFDPRFALTLRIESAVPAVSTFTKGSVVTFAIHSPAQLFGCDPQQGKSYRFSLQRKIVDGKVKYSSLRVQTPG